MDMANPNKDCLDIVCSRKIISAPVPQSLGKQDLIRAVFLLELFPNQVHSLYWKCPSIQAMKRELEVLTSVLINTRHVRIFLGLSRNAWSK